MNLLKHQLMYVSLRVVEKYLVTLASKYLYHMYMC